MDSNKLKENFPAAREGTYLFSAAVSPLHKNVYEKRMKHLKMLYQQGDIHWEKAIETVDNARALMAQLLAAKSEDIGFGVNTSYNMNILAMMLKQLGEGYNVVIPEDEFPSSSLPWYHHGFEVRRVPSKKSKIEVADILNQCDEKTVAVIHSHVQFSTGYRQDLEKLGAELKQKNIYFIVNATQSIGIFPIDVNKFNISALAASGHKWLCMGYGMSVLYLNEAFRMRFTPPIMGWLSVEDPGAMSSYPSAVKTSAAFIEMGVPAFNVLIGLEQALKEVLALGVDSISQQILSTRRYLMQKLQEKDLELISYDDESDDVFNSHNSANISVKVSEGEQLVERLLQDKIYVSCRNGGLRIAIHYFNSVEDIDRLIAKV